MGIRRSKIRDPRRAGFVSGGVVGVYAVMLFVPESLRFRLIFGGVVGIVLVGILLLIPLPEWREAEERKRLAAKLMIGEALAAALLATVVKLALVIA
ncbi:MAG TPA: hypothetical protein VK988_15705 [Acidimicrobiales bacterium]|nr:hypothetical protein [Acidimicrobiales bacterium]